MIKALRRVFFQQSQLAVANTLQLYKIVNYNGNKWSERMSCESFTYSFFYLIPGSGSDQWFKKKTNSLKTFNVGLPY